jgi:TonB family protein
MLASTVGVVALGQQEARPRLLPAGIVIVRAYDQAGGVLRQGVGFAVSDSGDVIAPGDLIDGASRVEIAAGGKAYNMTRWIAREHESGLVLLYAGIPSGAARPAIAGKSIPGVGEQVQVAALTEGPDPSIITGSVKAKNRSGEWQVLSVAGNLEGVPVGNPVFNTGGELIGIISRQTDSTGIFTVNAGDGLPNVVKRLLAVKDPDGTENPYGAPQSKSPVSIKDIPSISGFVTSAAISHAWPSYPDRGKQLHITGSVIVEIMIDETGHVASARAIGGDFHKPSDVSEEQARKVIPEFQKAGVDAARRWKFKPATIHGTPVKIIGTITFHFAM